jgi:hypothetical protein
LLEWGIWSLCCRQHVSLLPLNASSHKLGEEQHVTRAVICGAQSASLLRVMCMGEGIPRPLSCHPAPGETCSPKGLGLGLFVSHASSSPGCFFMVCASVTMMAQQVLSYAHGLPTLPTSYCTHHLIIFILASPSQMSNLLDIFFLRTA